jgi:hypothetical protein
MDGTSDFHGSSGSYSFSQSGFNHGPPPSYSQAGMHGAWAFFFFCFSLFYTAPQPPLPLTVKFSYFLVHYPAHFVGVLTKEKEKICFVSRKMK